MHSLCNHWLLYQENFSLPGAFSLSEGITSQVVMICSAGSTEACSRFLLFWLHTFFECGPSVVTYTIYVDVRYGLLTVLTQHAECDDDSMQLSVNVNFLIIKPFKHDTF